MIARSTRLPLIALLTLAACGGSPAPSETGSVATSGNVAVTGRVADPGPKGSVLVFAYTDVAANEDVSTREPASVGTIGTDGSFDLSVPPSASLLVVFLADARHDGVIDGGDAIAIFSAPELVDLQAGDQVHIADAALDFRSHRVTATLELARANEPAAPAHTPTPAP